ncbi:MAG: hypothetical protein KHY31_11745 [Clostridiales bacterium]|nr:hypothetical protein [Clostridiales bacterium]
MRKRITALLCTALILVGIPFPVYAEETDGKNISVGVEQTDVLPMQDGVIKEELDGEYAYVESLTVENITDGTMPFDENDNAGNDAGKNNKRVRSFDTVTYDLSFVTQMLDPSTVSYVKAGYLEFEFLLPYTAQEAEFVTDSMAWMESDFTLTSEDIQIGEEIKTCQVLRGRYHILPSTSIPNAIPGTGELNVEVKVQAMPNNAIIQPIFRVWLEHQQEKPRAEAVPEGVTVSAAPKYNVQVKEVPGSSQSKKSGIFDFNTGNSDAPDKAAGQVSGRINTYGITLQLYNGVGKGLKGIELPQGDITFDLVLENSFYLKEEGAESVDVMEHYAPLLWSYSKSSGTTVGNEERNQTVANNVGRPSGAAPYNDGNSAEDYKATRCYNGGDWSAQKEGNIIHVTVSDYEIDKDCFPTMNIDGREGIDEIYGTREEIERGCFSAGEFYFVVPYNNSETGEYILEDPSIVEDKEAEGGDFEMVVRAQNLKATSVTGQALPEDPDGNENQTDTTDDRVLSQMPLRQEGGYSNTVLWSTDEKQGLYDVNGRGDGELGSCLRNGLDWAVPGQHLAISWAMSNKEGGDMPNRMVVGKSLMKFEPDGVELTGEILYRKESVQDAGYEANVYFATKADGTDWEDETELRAATMTDMKYYRSLEEIPEGHVCVGALFEVYPKDGDPNNITYYDGGSYPMASLPVTASTDTEAINQVYMVTVTSMIWRLEDYINLEEPIPSLLGNDPEKSIELPKASISKHEGAYVKVEYDENGYKSGHRGDYQEGDSLYIIGEQAQIRKNVAQKSDIGDEKKVYNLDNGQRTVDYILSPGVEPAITETTGDVEEGKRTTVVIKDRLPEGLEYVYGSAYLGGSYTQNPSPGRQGTVTGGVQIEPEITRNEDGTIELVWIIENVIVGGTMEPIYFSASIDAEAKNSQQFLNTASIASTLDMREQAVYNGNYSEKGIQVSKLGALSLNKFVDEPIYEQGDPIGYTITVANNSANEQTEQVMLDVLPQNGDEKGSNFSGSLTIIKWQLDTSMATNWREWRVFYTTDKKVKETTSEDYTADDFEDGITTTEGLQITWTEASIDENGEIPLLKDKAVSAVAVIGNLKGNEAYKADTEMAVPDADGGDKLVNSLSNGPNEVDATAYILTRSLSGTAWLDSNQDGIRDGEEAILPGITVTLLKENEEGIYETVLGDDKEPRICKTDEEGKYQFEGLHAGTYGVRFGTEEEVSIYKASEPNKDGVPDYMDSDGIPVMKDGVLTCTEIRGIEMPKKEDMNTYLYESRYNDSGFYMNVLNLTVEKEVTGNLGDKEKLFTFEVILKNLEGDLVDNVSYLCLKGETGTESFQTVSLEFVKGKATFQLKDGEYICMQKIPANYVYDIKEMDGETDGYTVTIPDNAAGTLKENTVVHFINEKETTGDLGIGMTKVPFILLIAGAGTGGYVWNRSRKSRNRRK